MSRIGQIKEMLEENPNDSFLLFALAKEYEGLDDFEGAIRQFEQLKELDPHYLGTYYHLGKLYELQGKKSDATNVYDLGITLAKEQKDWHTLSELNGVRANIDID